MLNPFSSKAFSMVDSGPPPFPTQKSVKKKQKHCKTSILNKCSTIDHVQFDLPEFIIAAEAISVVTSQTTKIEAMNNGNTK